jgi:hypothetical protein
MRHNQPDRATIARDVAHLGVTEACRRHGIHRSTWYRWEAHPIAPTSGPGRTDMAQAIERIALEHPTWGCDRIAYFLSFDHIKVSSPTVQKILIEGGLGRKEQRMEKARLLSRAPRRE